MIKERICAGIAAVKGRGSTPAVNPERRPKSQRLVPKVLALVAADAALLADRPKNTVAEIVRRTRAEQLGRANREVPDLSA